MITKTKADEQLTLMKIQTGMLGILFVTILLAVILLVSQFKNIKKTMSIIEEDVAAIDISVLNGAATSLKEAADTLSGIDIEAINSAADGITEAAKTLTSVDVKSLNAAVASLKQAADTLKALDIDKFNNLVSALEGTATRLQNTSDAIAGFFGR